jgi:preprotein translocase subunit Sec61beta
VQVRPLEVCEVKYVQRNRIGLTAATSIPTFLKFSRPLFNMAKDNQAQMPSSQGGLVQYFDADTGIDIDPKMVIGFSGAVVVLELALHMGLV